MQREQLLEKQRRSTSFITKIRNPPKSTSSFSLYFEKETSFLLFIHYFGLNLFRKKQPKQVDLSQVLDFKYVSESFNRNGELPPGVVHVNCGFDRPIFGLENRLGIYFFPFDFN